MENNITFQKIIYVLKSLPRLFGVHPQTFVFIIFIQFNRYELMSKAASVKSWVECKVQDGSNFCLFLSTAVSPNSAWQIISIQ